MIRKKISIGKILFYFFIAVLIILLLMPVLWAVLLSFRRIMRLLICLLRCLSIKFR